MATLVERLRSIISSENDDFFSDEVLLFYLNKSQHRVVSYLSSLEQRSEKSLRGLDSLRKVVTVNAGAVTLIHNGVSQNQMNLPTDVLQIIMIRHAGYRIAREISVSKTHHVFEGNYKPTQDEIFWFVLDNNGTKIVRFYVSDTHQAGSCEIFYIAKPANIAVNATAFTSLPLQLENAVLYGAAEMAIAQESVKDPNNSADLFRRIYQEELAGGAF